MARKGAASKAENQAGDPEEKALAPAAPAAVAEATAETDWEPADPDWVREDYADYEESAAERRRAGAVTKPEKGKTTWRPLPPIKGTKRLFGRIWTHSVNNEVLNRITQILAALPDVPRKEIADALKVFDLVESHLGQGFKATVCPSKMSDEPCLYCDLVAQLYKLARATKALGAAAELAKEIGSKEEIFVNAVRLDKKEEMDRGPRALQLTIGLYEKMNRIWKEPETAELLGGDFSHPETGFNLIIDRIETGKDIKIGNKSVKETKYEISPSRQRTKLPNYDWLKHMHDLTKIRDLPDDVTTRGILEGDGSAPAKADPNDPDERAFGGGPAPAQRQVASRPAGNDEDWMEDPANPGVFDYRRNLRASGRSV